MSPNKKPAAKSAKPASPAKKAAPAAKRSASAEKKVVAPAKAAAKKSAKAAAKKAAPEVYPGETAPERVIRADFRTVKGERSDVWRDCVGAGRIGEGLRETWRKQLAKCKKELGFRFLRAHGLFHDEMRVYSEDKAGNPVYNFMYIDDVFDFLLSIGVKPFVELSFMPEKLASGKTTIFWWKANVTPPKKHERWADLIRATVRHWTERYGEAEVKTWRFEVWNEPDLDVFWDPGKKTTMLDAYLELYKHTARAVKSVNKAYAVGGPSGAGLDFIAPLVRYCRKNRLPLDFISFHQYGFDPENPALPKIDRFGGNYIYLMKNLRHVADCFNRKLEDIRKNLRCDVPVYITEWHASPSPVDPVHDSYFAAPFILEQLRNTEKMACMSLWTFTDIFEECGPAPRPFHGGFGLMTFQSIPKAAYRAYQCLAALGPTELVSSDASSYVCKDAKGGVQALFWDLSHPTQGGRISNQDTFFDPHPAKDKGHALFSIAGLKPGEYDLRVTRIGYRAGDAYSAWLEEDGAKTDISREEIARLTRISQLRPMYRAQVAVMKGEAFQLGLDMKRNDVFFVELIPLKK